MTTAIETYLNSLPKDILTIDISRRGIQSLPDLTRFKNLERLYCYDNQLTSLPTTLPPNLKILYCNDNKLTSLPTTLPQNLEKLHCSNNQLTSLPTTLPENLKLLHCDDNKLTSLPTTLPQNLQILDCDDNQLTSLPRLPQNIEVLYCSYNQLTSMPTLPQKLDELHCSYNPIYEIVKNVSLEKIKQNIQILNNSRHLYYCLKLKKPFRKWLWENVKEPKIKIEYHPKRLLEKLGYEDDLDIVLDNWE